MIYFILFICMFTPALVQSQNSGCDVGWFGSSCQYKCRCTVSCERDGSCTPGSQCQKGWFGPACQYADLALNVPIINIPGGNQILVITDGNDSTCSMGIKSQFLMLRWAESYLVTWMRVYARNIESLSSLIVQFSPGKGGTLLNATCARSAVFNSPFMDIVCDLDVPVNLVVLKGEAVESLCSLYISGGRNIAHRQNTSLSSPYSSSEWYASDRAVDGNTDTDFSHSRCTVTGGTRDQIWNIYLSRPATVYRYILYNRAGVNIRGLQKFTLRSFDKRNVQVFNHTDNGGPALLVYKVLPGGPSLSVKKVSIEGASTDNYFTLCEVEIYGETECAAGMYGRDCEHTCSCTNTNKPCFVSTGGCPLTVPSSQAPPYYTTSRCPDGYYGENCTQSCQSGTYGSGCVFDCSPFCAHDSSRSSDCHKTDGTCSNGCVSGYDGNRCDLIIVSSHHVGTIAGGVSGGIGAILLVVVKICCLCRRCRAKHVQSIEESGNTDVNGVSTGKIDNTPAV